MKLSRFNAIFNGMNGTAKKVYEVVPISSHWSQFKIMKELERTGKQLDPATVKGCLGYMLSVGIIEQNREQEFMRTPLRAGAAHNAEPDPIPEAPPATEEETKMATNPDVPAPPSNNPIFEILSKLAERAQSIADMADDLREDIEKAALQVQADHEVNARELAKLAEFKKLMALLQKD